MKPGVNSLPPIKEHLEPPEMESPVEVMVPSNRFIDLMEEIIRQNGIILNAFSRPKIVLKKDDE